MPPANSQACLEAALRYAKLGWRVFPTFWIDGTGVCACNRPDCKTPGKHPIIPKWPERATTDPERIRDFWTRWPFANVAMATGRGIVDLEHEVDCEDHILALEASSLGPLPDTVSWLSGGGGVHRFFQTSVPIPCRTAIGQEILGIVKTGIDVRGEGGAAILPPSNHYSGGVYAWGNLTPEVTEIAELPSTWVDFLVAPVSRTGAHGGADEVEGGLIPQGQRNTTLASLAGNMRRVGMTYAEILPAILKVNEGRCQPPLSIKEVESVAASICRYPPDQVAVAVAEGHWEQDRQVEVVEDLEDKAQVDDPGPLPEKFLHAPGFIDAVTEHCLANAPYPEPVLAFCGAVGLQALLAGRKVRDPAGARSNLYLLALAEPGGGKDYPRKVNDTVLHEVGMGANVAGGFASGEGIEDRMHYSKAMLFQTDEIDYVLEAIVKSRDGRAERIMEMLLKFYSASQGMYHIRVKAGMEPAAISQPSLTLYGTATPICFYRAFSEKMLTNGFFARMLVFEAGLRSDGREPTEVPVPAPIITVAKHWASMSSGAGNLGQENPSPMIVPLGEGVVERYKAIRAEESAAYRAAHAVGDTVAMALWARAGEKARRLALVYACSEDYLSPKITIAGVDWGWAITSHQTRRMLFMAQAHVAENPFHASCLRLKRKLREAPGQELAHSVLLKRMKLDARSFQEVVVTLVQQGDLQVVTIPRGGSPKKFYRLKGETREGNLGGKVKRDQGE